MSCSTPRISCCGMCYEDYKNESALFPEKEELSQKNMSPYLCKNEDLKGLFEPNTKVESLPVQTLMNGTGNEIGSETMKEFGNYVQHGVSATKREVRFDEKSLLLDEDIQKQLLELQQKGIDINNLLR